MSNREHREEGDHIWLTMVADVELFQEEYYKHFKKVVQKITLPGFRKGHAPFDMSIQYLKNRGVFIKECESFVGNIIERSVLKLSKEDKEWDAKIFGFPIENKVTEFDVDSWHIKFESRFEKYPVVELGNYETIETIIEHKQVNRNMCPVTANREAQNKDVVALAMLGKGEDGENVNKYTYDMLEIDLENTKLRKELLDVIIGSKAKDKKEVKIKDKGKEINIEIWIIDVREKEAVDEKLVEKLKIPGADTVEKLGDLVEKQHKVHNSYVRYHDILKWLFSNEHKIEPFPIENVKREASKNYSLLTNRGNKNVSYENLVFEQSKNLKTTLVLEAIAKKEGLEVNDQDKTDFAKDIEENPWIYGNRTVEDIFNCSEEVLKEYILQFKTIQLLIKRWSFSN